MQVNRTVHRDRFTVVPHAIAQHPTMSLVARGLLLMLLSLPNGFRIDCRKLADSLPGVGRRGVQNALDELEAAGYYVRTTTRDQWGRLRTTTAVYDIPQNAATAQVVPIPGLPGIGRPDVEASGTPLRGKKQEKETLPTLDARIADGETLTDITALTDGEGEGETPTEETPNTSNDASGDERQGGDDNPDDDGPKGGEPADDGASVVPLLGRIRQHSGNRIAVPMRDAGKVLPLIRDWYAAGATDGQIVAAICSDLPSEVRSATGFVLARLRDRLPVPVEVPAPAAPMATCDACERAFRGSGHLCAGCQSTPAAPVEVEAPAARGVDLDTLRRSLADAQARSRVA
ncbi:hypothetical protein ACQEVF_22180 [Nonomuraea polychroma]|uniref:hypothetical protein n=1 Tax=Nonomuraea polychroma TaxID=46176 RepID=UPI003D8BD651